MQKNVNDFTIHGAGFLRITKYGIFFNGESLEDIMRNAAGINDDDENDYRGQFAEILIRVKYTKQFLRVLGQPVAEEKEGGSA